MTQEDSVRRLAEIRERAEKATPGPWRRVPVDGLEWGKVEVAPLRCIDIEGRTDDEAAANAAFIANSREDVPYLLSLIDSLTAERDHERHRKEVAEFEREEVRAALTRAIEAADSRAEAAEAREARLRDALVEIRAFQYDDRLTSASAYSMCRIADAALATPPSEGQS